MTLIFNLMQNINNSIFQPLIIFFNNIKSYVQNHNILLSIILTTICYIILSLIVIIKKPFKRIQDYSILFNTTLSIIGFFLILTVFTIFMNNNANKIDMSGYDKKTIIKEIFNKLSNVFLITVVILGFIWIFSLLTKTSNISLVITVLINIFIVSGVIYLLYRWLSKNPYIQNFLKNNNLARIFVNLIILIPCLIFDSISYIYNDFKNTKKITFIILLIEIVLILLYFLLPKLINYIFTHTGKQLLKNPIYLNQEKDLASYDDLIINSNDYEYFKKKQLYGGFLEVSTFNKEKQPPNFNYNYALSSWVFLFSNPPNLGKSQNEFTSILDYGSRPNISFNPSNNTLRVSVKKNNDEFKVIYETNKIPLQKWNNITINYLGGTLDIFINGILVGTSNNVIPYMEYDNISSGSDKGLQGGICNVMYFPKALTKTDLDFHFNSFKDLDLPVL
jgi:hypothetical protein